MNLSAKVLDYLLLGQVIKIGDRHFALSEELNLCCLGHKEQVGSLTVVTPAQEPDPTTLINTFADLADFIKLVQSMSAEDRQHFDVQYAWLKVKYEKALIYEY